MIPIFSSLCIDHMNYAKQSRTGVNKSKHALEYLTTGMKHKMNSTEKNAKHKQVNL